MGPKAPRSTVLSQAEEAIIVAFRKHTLLPLDDCLYALQATIPHLTRSALHRCLQRHGISRLPEIEGEKPSKKKFKTYPIGYACSQLGELLDRSANGSRKERRSDKFPPWGAAGKVERVFGSGRQGCKSRR